MRGLRTRAALIAGTALALAAGLLGTAPGSAAAESNGGVRVMPLGDSITEGTQVPGGYRIGLWQRLAAARYRASYNGALAANASTTFGFLAGGTPSAPALTCTPV